MAWSYSPKKAAEVQGHVENSTRTYPEIAALTGIPASTVSRWKCVNKWKRPPGSFERRPMRLEERAAIERAIEAGAHPNDVGIMVGRSADVVRRVRSAARTQALEERGAAPPPASVEALCEALTVSGIDRDEALRRTPQVFSFLWAEMLRGEPSAARACETLARATAVLIKMPDPSGPALGAPHDDPYAGPQSFDETNALLEEFALRLDAWDAGRKASLPGEPAPSPQELDR